MKKAQNNKGFSLVELIVVVLILGILAVAISPQVMKWVGTSKISADKDAANGLKAAINTAMADWQGVDNGKIAASGSATLTVTVGAGNVKTTAADFSFGTTTTGWSNLDKLVARINEVTSGDYPVSQYDTQGFKIQIEPATGKVTITYGAATA